MGLGLIFSNAFIFDILCEYMTNIFELILERWVTLVMCIGKIGDSNNAKF